ncbi:MAG: membrane protein insertase YidC, partial [Nocardioidaceae bacterium]
LVFAVGGIAFPIGVLFYWTTSNLWTMGQQFYVIRNNPAPGTPAARAKAARDDEKAKRKGLPAAPAAEEEAAPPAAPEPPKRQQPKKQTRSQRKKQSPQQTGKPGGQGQQDRKADNPDKGTGRTDEDEGGADGSPAPA